MCLCVYVFSGIILHNCISVAALVLVFCIFCRNRELVKEEEEEHRQKAGKSSSYAIFFRDSCSVLLALFCYMCFGCSD